MRLFIPYFLQEIFYLPRKVVSQVADLLLQEADGTPECLPVQIRQTALHVPAPQFAGQCCQLIRFSARENIVDQSVTSRPLAGQFEFSIVKVVQQVRQVLVIEGAADSCTGRISHGDVGAADRCGELDLIVDMGLPGYRTLTGSAHHSNAVGRKNDSVSDSKGRMLQEIHLCCADLQTTCGVAPDTVSPQKRGQEKSPTQMSGRLRP